MSGHYKQKGGNDLIIPPFLYQVIRTKICLLSVTSSTSGQSSYLEEIQKVASLRIQRSGCDLAPSRVCIRLVECVRNHIPTNSRCGQSHKFVEPKVSHYSATLLNFAVGRRIVKFVFLNFLNFLFLFPVPILLIASQQDSKLDACPVISKAQAEIFTNILR